MEDKSLQKDAPPDDSDPGTTSPSPNPPRNEYVEVSVTWTCAPEYDGWKAGSEYTFTAALATDAYSFGGAFPSVTVKVGEQPTDVAKIGEDLYPTLQDAVDAAQYGETIELLANLKLDKGVRIYVKGGSELNLTIDLAGHEISGGAVTTAGIYVVLATTADSVEMLTIKNGTLSGFDSGDLAGGAISSQDNLTVENCVFRDNHAGQGGAISLSGTTLTNLTVTGCTFIGNSANYSGGAISAPNTATMRLTRSRFVGNEISNLLGGAVCADKGTVTVEGCVFEDNSAPYGGAIGSSQATVTLTNSTFSGNAASQMGGAVHSQGLIVEPPLACKLTVNGGSFTGNTASYGGAISVTTAGSVMEMNGATLTGNKASSYGGAIYTQDGCTLAINATLKENTADGWGGAVYANEGSVTLDGVMDGNKANLGGGVFAQNGTVIVNSNATGNNATKGGALYVNMGSATVNGDLTGNVAEESGGAVYCSWSDLTVTGKITGNSAAEGGGVYVLANEFGEQWASKVDLTKAVLCNNLASYAGADLYDGGLNVTTIQTVGEGWSLDACRDHTIDNWYTDAAGARWSHTRAQVYAMGEDGTATITEPTALRAAHKLMVLKPDEPNLDWETSKSKTATDLDANYESQVTLSLPAAEEKLTSAVMFVLDKSSCTENVTTKALEMLENLSDSAVANGATIQVAAVQFAGRATVSCNWTELTDTAIAEGGAIYEGLKERKINSGTNLQAGLLVAQELLEEDIGVANNRKYVVVITDGLTRMFIGEDGTLKNIYNEFAGDSHLIWGNPSSWCAANGFEEGSYPIPGGNWDTYFAALTANVARDGDTYVYDYDTYEDMPAEAPPTYIPEGGNSLEYALCMDRAIYEAYVAYRTLESSGYRCYTVFTKDTPQVTGNDLGQAFIKALNNGSTLDFNDIQNDIYYLLDAGSQILDVIGYGTDDKGNAYDFDFVNSLDALHLTVGGVELSKEELVDPQFSMPGVTSAYGFGGGAGGYDFVLYYYENGQDGASDECFVWEINVPVSNFAPVQLTYTVKLTDPQTAAGTYGGLYTNASATLYPVDTNGKDGTPEEFQRPVVDYTVGGGTGPEGPGTDPTPPGGTDPTPPGGGGTDIPDGNTPTTDLPDQETPTTELPEEETPTTELPEEETPLAEVPETGDMSALWLAMTALSGTGLAGVTFLGRKKRDEE